MSFKSVLFAGAVLSSVVPGAVAGAQFPTETSFGVAAGASVSTGSFGQRTNSGFNLSGAATFQQLGQPFGIRLEGSYNEFAIANEDIQGNVQVTALTVNAVLNLSTQQVGRRRAANASASGPYLIAGLGLYNVNEPTEFEDTFTGQLFEQNVYSNDIGFNIGGGYHFALSGFTGYVEARYHTVENTDYTFLPIVFGITF